jgi:hypothetical protein
MFRSSPLISSRAAERARWAEFVNQEARLMETLSIHDARCKAQAALAGSPVYELRELQVEWHDHALLVSGTVSSFYHKQLAQEVVRTVCDDVDVVNAICVEA